MLKHKEQIEGLTPQQKIALLVDAHGHFEDSGEALPVSMLSVTALWECNRSESGEQIFPSAASLANAWSPKLFADVAEHLAARGVQRGANLFLLPDTKAACSVYGKGLSEEPRLTGALVGAAATALSDAGLTVCMHAPVPTVDDVAYLHGEVDTRMLYDRMARPFRAALGGARCQAVLLPEAPAGDAYADMADKMMRAAVPDGLMQLCTNVDHDHTTATLLENKLLLGGSAAALEAALENYNRIRHSVEEGGATVDELNHAVEDGSAISEETLDAALDRRLSLVEFCQAGAQSAERESWLQEMEASMQQSALQAARESVVLLKNDKKILPLRAKSKIAVIGDVISDGEEGAFVGFAEKFSAAMQKSGYRYMGFAKGYHLERARSEELIPEALKLAKSADTVVVFLGMGQHREENLQYTKHLSLPANQLALFDALSRCGKPIVAVIMGSRLPDMFFDKWARGTVLAPGEGCGVAAAVAEVLAGKHNPTGHLAYTGYDFPDATFVETQRRMRKGVQKTGPFVGYRYAISDGLDIKYSFGCGETYTACAYSNLRFLGGNIHVNLHNQGKKPLRETVQVYISKSDSAILRPQTELAAYKTVTLKAGEKRTVEISMQNLGVWDPKSGTTVVENGKYRISVGRALTSLPLSAEVQIAGKTLAAQRYNLSDYLHTVSNIRSERYTMEASCKPMKMTSILQKLGVLLILLSLFADVIYITAGLLSFFQLQTKLTAFSASSLGCTALGILLVIVHAVRQRILAAIRHKREAEATKALFADAEVVDTDAIESLFVEEFDVPEEMAKREVEVYTEKDDGLYAYMAVDTTLPAISAEMVRFFENEGLRMSAQMADAVLAAMMTSRLLIVRNDTYGIFARFVRLLGEFFGTESHLDEVQTVEGAEQTLLHLRYANGIKQETEILHGIYAAQGNANKAHFLGLRNVHFDEMGHLLMPYIRYFSNPQNTYAVSEGDLSVSLPANLWFVLGVADGESIENIESFVANFAAVIDLRVEQTEGGEQTVMAQSINCQQMEALVFRSKQSTEIDEDLWKEVDRLENFVNERTPYHIGNKLFLQLERYLAVYTTCGGTMQQAMDSAVAVKLLPAIMANLKGLESMAEVDLIQTLESIFGEENVAQSAYMVKHPIVTVEGTPEPELMQEETEAGLDEEEELNEQDTVQAVSEAPAEVVEEAPVAEAAEAPTEVEEEAPAEEVAAEQNPDEAAEQAIADTVEESTEESEQGEERDAE